LVSIQATIPEGLKIELVLPSELPANWKDTIIPVSLQERGTSWVNASESAILQVPSVVVDNEWNYVLNPSHPDFAQITWGAPTPFSLDPRLLK
jgi:RES domain-containing protein